MKQRWLPTDWQDFQRVMLGSIGVALFAYQWIGGDIDALIEKIQKSGTGALIVWAVFVKEPPRSHEDNGHG